MPREVRNVIEYKQWVTPIDRSTRLTQQIEINFVNVKVTAVQVSDMTHGTLAYNAKKGAICTYSQHHAETCHLEFWYDWHQIKV